MCTFTCFPRTAALNSTCSPIKSLSSAPNQGRREKSYKQLQHQGRSNKPFPKQSDAQTDALKVLLPIFKLLMISPFNHNISVSMAFLKWYLHFTEPEHVRLRISLTLQFWRSTNPMFGINVALSQLLIPNLKLLISSLPAKGPLTFQGLL